MKFASILGRFERVEGQSDGGYLALCPAHNDSNPSLRIWRGDDNKVRITCRSGCKPEAVISAAKLEWSDLFDAEGDGLVVPSARPLPITDAHAYELGRYIARRSASYFTSETGDEAKEYVRRRFGVDYELADELQLGADFGEDEYATDDYEYRSASFKKYPRVTVPLFDFEGTPRGLQGRDLSGSCPGRWVSLRNPRGHRWSAYGVFRGHGGYGATLVTEGPGDALSAVAVGYDSVAVRGASLAASSELVTELAHGLSGSQVVVCGDADNAGHGFVKALAEGLRAHGITVYVLVPPPGFKDLSAWQEARPETFATELHNAVRAAEPYSVKANASAAIEKRTGASSVSADQGEAAAQLVAQMLDQYDATDTMNAHALVAWADGTIRYAPGLGFYVWNGRHWERSEVRVRQEVHRLGAALVLAGKLKEARGFTMTTNIDNLMTELRSVPSVYVTPDEFDAHRHLLSFRNCTVDLRTGDSHPHRKEDMITFCVDVDYRSDAQCPRWESFLGEIFPRDPDLVPFAQRLVGYGITGSTDEQCFVVLYGKGANGKSVFTDTLTTVFGAITQTTRFATFEEKPGGAIPNDLAALRNARLVMASEGKAGRVMDESVLKSVTGKDKIQARFLHKEFFTYSPQFLIMLATNHKPNFVSQDEGMWRRVKLIPFVRWFAPDERDYDLDRKLLAEREGIAAWAVRGAIEWYKHGLGDPQVIVNETREYRETSDSLAGFFPGVLEREDGATVGGSEAYNEYQAWCEEEGLRGADVVTRKSFYRLMEERGVSKRKTKVGIVLDGVKLAASRDVTMPVPGSK